MATSITSKDILVPGRLRSAAQSELAITSDIKDAALNKTQDVINQNVQSLDTTCKDLTQKVDTTFSFLEEAIKNLGEQGVDAVALENRTQLLMHSRALHQIAEQLHSLYDESSLAGNVYIPHLKFTIVEEDEMEKMLDENTYDAETVYFQLEPIET